MKVTPVSIVIFISDVTEKGLSLWMQKRRENGHLDGLWEFPGGKIEAFENPRAAAIREVKEEVCFDCRPLYFNVFSHCYNDRQVRLNVFYSHQEKKDLPEGAVTKWFPIDFKNGAMGLKGQIPEINHKIIDRLCAYLSKEFTCQSL